MAAASNPLLVSRPDASNGEDTVPEASPVSSPDAGDVEGAAAAAVPSVEDGLEVLRLRGGGESSEEEEEEGSVSDGERAAAAAAISSEDVDDEPDEDTGRITGVPLDMDADCELDEVEFGDGDESHDILQPHERHQHHVVST